MLGVLARLSYLRAGMIIIVDDDAVVRSSLKLLLSRAGYQVEAYDTPGGLLARLREVEPRLIMMDMNYSLDTCGQEGLELLEKVKVFCPRTPVVLMTAWGSIELAVRGMQLGAFDFITKPWDNRHLLSSIETALSLSAPGVASEILPSRAEVDSLGDYGFIIGQSPEIVSVLATVARIAPTNASVLITGESGTGKELIAEAIHRNSQRRRQPFVKVNLGGVSQSLFESEMFGHRRGAFTDATSDRVGRFELAHRGTIFLDEIGELDMSCQVKLLRVLQDQSFEPLGDSTPRKVDVRVVSATNVDLPAMVAQRTFREDLMYRINLIEIHLPALRERSSDIPLLARHFASAVSEQNGLGRVAFDDEAMSYLRGLPFPGNIRELKNLVERTILVSGHRLITAEDLMAQTGHVASTPQTSPSQLGDVERMAIEEAIQRHGGNMSQVARSLGISRGALYRRLEKYGL